ncbi:hypothetical protein [Inquilinus sp. CAU 1745]|uniref:hypothetical protein n=1 Tax=Inquilinus sp. CAU 1745 TaxID=3140369 RepID=UPI00325ADE6E
MMVSWPVMGDFVMKEGLTTSWAVAWRAADGAVRASVAPFAAGLLVFAAEPLIYEALYRVQGLSETLSEIWPILYSWLLQTIYLGLDGVFVAAMLEALLSGRPWRDSLPPIVPTTRALRFGLALTPLAIVGAALNETGGAMAGQAFMSLPLERMEAMAPFFRAAHFIVTSPALPWILYVIVTGMLAVRLLHLPALRSEGSARPTLGLFATTAIAIAVNILLYVGLETGLATLPLVGQTVLPMVVAWYVGSYVALTLIAAGVAVMLMRRRGTN